MRDHLGQIRVLGTLTSFSRYMLHEVIAGWVGTSTKSEPTSSSLLAAPSPQPRRRQRHARTCRHAACTSKAPLCRPAHCAPPPSAPELEFDIIEIVQPGREELRVFLDDYAWRRIKKLPKLDSISVRIWKRNYEGSVPTRRVSVEQGGESSAAEGTLGESSERFLQRSRGTYLTTGLYILIP